MSSGTVSRTPAHGAGLIDSHTPLHGIVGFAAGILGIDPHVAVAVFIGARIVEQSLHTNLKHALFEREQQSLGNELTDLLFEVAGLHYGQALRRKLTSEPQPAAGVGQYFVPGYVRHL